jgi:hypothetical protein
MKLMKRIFFFCGAIAIISILISFLVSTKQEVVKTITVHAPANKIFSYLMLLQNAKNWPIWSNADTSVSFKLSGTDGMIGATTSWAGNDPSAERGEMVLTTLKQDSEITYQINMEKPQKIDATSTFYLQEHNGTTTVTLKCRMEIPRPGNLAYLFYNLEKRHGKDFDRGLAALKMIAEKWVQIEKPLEIRVDRFPATKYVVIKQKVVWADYKEFFPTHFNHILQYPLKAKFPGQIKTALFFSTDSTNTQSDVAAAIPIPTGFAPNLNAPEQQTFISPSRSVRVLITGREDIKLKAYNMLNAFVKEKKLVIKMPIIEQYLSDSTTNIIYLVE